MQCCVVHVISAVVLIANAQDLTVCDELVPSNCGGEIKEGPKNQHILHAARPRWPADGFCTAFSGKTVTPPYYAVYAEMYNQSPKVGHPGVAFNVKDVKNFDFIYFRPHSASSCYQIGKLIAGKTKWGTSKNCPQGPPAHQKWFSVRVSVKGKRATAYLNGRKVVCWTTLSPTLGRGGIIVANGYKNTIRFRNFQVTST